MQKFDDGSEFPYDEYKSKKPFGALSQSQGNIISPKKPAIKEKGSATKKALTNSEAKKTAPGSANKDKAVSNKKTMQIPQHSFEESVSSGNFGRFPLNQIPDMGSPIFPQAQAQPMAKLKDLCPEDKSKIGELIKKLASEKEEKEKLLTKFMSTKESYEKKIETLMQQQQRLLKESEEAKNQVTNSMSLIKSLQASAEKQKPLQSSSVFNTKENQHKSPQKAGKFLLKPPVKDSKPPNKGVFSNLTESFKKQQQQSKGHSESSNNSDFEEPTRDEKPAESSKPMSDISRLKDEIEELTLSIKSLSISPKGLQSTSSDKSKSQNLFSAIGNKNRSPIKLVEDCNPPVEREIQKPIQDKPFGSSKQETQKKQKANKSPILIKSSSSEINKKPLPIVNSSSDEDEDEVEIARKWLNMRKEKVRQVNEAITHDKNDSKPDSLPPSKGKHSYRDLLKREAQSPSHEIDQETHNLGGNEIKSKRTLIPAKQLPQLVDNGEEDNDIQPQKLQNIAESLPSQLILKTSTPQKKLVINLDEIDEEKIHEIHNLLNSKLSELSDKKKSPGNEKKLSLSASRGSKTTQDSKGVSVKAPFANSNVFKEDLFSQNLAQSGSLYHDMPQNYSQRPQSLEKEELEMHDLESDRISPEPDLKHPEKEEIKSINNSEIFPEKAADKKLAEIDRLYEEKLKEYLNIRDRMLNSLSYQEEPTKQKVVLAPIKENNNPRKIESNIAIPSREYEERTFTSGRSQDSRTTANFLNNPGSVESARFAMHEYPGKTLETNRDEFLYSGDRLLDSKPQESTTRTFQQSGDVRTLAKHFSRPDDHELLQLNEDFYDDQLFDIVSEIERNGHNGTSKQSTKQEPLHVASLKPEELLAQQNFKKKTKVDQEFAELFNTVRTITGDTGKKNIPILSSNKQDHNTLSLSNKDVSDWILSKYTGDDEDELTSGFISEIPTTRKERDSVKEINPHKLRTGTANNSYVESDSSILMIRQRLNEMSSKQDSFRKNRDKLF